MTFKEIQAGMPVYIFDRTNLHFTIDKASSVTPSHFDMGMPSGKAVVDVTVGDQKYTIEDGLTVAYFNNNAISIDRNHILREIEVYKNNSEAILKDVPKHQTIVEQCTKILEENNPELMAKRINEERFNKIEDSIGELKGMVESFIQKLS